MGLNNSQYDSIMRDYNKKQVANRHDMERRISEVYEAVPGIKELDQAVSSMALFRAKKMLSGDKTALERLKEDMKDLQEQRSILVKAGGFSLDYMDGRYSCVDCKDTGYIDNKKCHCFKQAVIELLYTQSNLKETLRRENFDTFSYEFFDSAYIIPETGKTQREYMKGIVAKCWHFIDSFGSGHGNLLFTGTTGVGKTFISNCIAKELIHRYFSVIYLSATELFDIFSKNKFDFNKEETQDMYQYILDCDLLIIDDLGTELTNTFTTSQLFYCINERQLRKKSVIISTNLSLNLLRDCYSERITSRIISNYEILALYGEDIRIQKKIDSRNTP